MESEKKKNIIKYRKIYPPGYRFKPTDDELIREYLLKKIRHEQIPIDEISCVKLKENNPKALAATHPQVGEGTWYFFTPRDRKYPNGSRPNRAGDTGYWKATGADTKVCFEGKSIGYKKALVFYEGKPPNGVKTNWIMHEFRVQQHGQDKTNPDDMRLDDWVLCRIYEKAPRPRKKKEREEDESSDNQDDVNDNSVVDAAAAADNNIINLGDIPTEFPNEPTDWLPDHNFVLTNPNMNNNMVGDCGSLVQQQNLFDPDPAYYFPEGHEGQDFINKDVKDTGGASQQNDSHEASQQNTTYSYLSSSNSNHEAFYNSFIRSRFGQ